MGTVSINVEVHCTKKVLRKLTAKIESTRKTVVLPKNRGTLLETWDKNGEPGTEALGIEQRVPVKRLLTYIKSGKLRPASESGASFEVTPSLSISFFMQPSNNKANELN